jgi:hypothetical protein
VKKERRKGFLTPTVKYDANGFWQVFFRRRSEPVAEVQIKDADQSIRQVYTGLQAKSPLARGEHGREADRAHLYLIVAGLLFALPFVDRRRPLRMLHLDLAVMLALGIYHFFFARGEVALAIPLVYPVLLYLLARVLWVAFHPPGRVEALVPHASTRLLAAALLLVVAGRMAVCATSRFIMDGGYDSVWGADTITNGYQLYALSAFPLNTYGPIVYLAYVPFEAIFPFGGGQYANAVPAAHAAAMTFDLVTIGGLVVLGRRLRPGGAGTLLGLALAYGWATYPWTLAVLIASTNDSLVPALIVWALVLVQSAPARAGLLGLASAAKLFPLPLLPAFARSEGDGWSVRRITVYGAVAVVVIVLAIAPYLPHPGGVNQFIDLVARSETGRQAIFSIWGLHPSLEWLKLTARVLMIALGIALFFFPRERSVTTLAAAAAALIIAQELSLEHWYYLYASWFTAFVLIALFTRLPTGEPEPYPARAPT